MRMPRRKFLGAAFLATALACLLCSGFTAGAKAESEKLTVRVMTRNMDAGTDLLYVASATTEEGFAQAVLATVNEVAASNIPGRAALLAAEVMATQPDLIALQEVTTWRIPSETGTVVLDQLELLQAALEAAGLHYRVAVKQQLTDIPVVIPEVSLNVRFTDHDVILVRSDLPPGQLDVIGTETHLYDLLLPFPVPGGSIPVLRGWIAVDAKIRGARFKFVTTHLESAVLGQPLPQAAYYQLAQVIELLTALQETELPVILAGDFNSDAENSGTGPDQTGTAALISSQGYTDAWRAVHLNPADHGFTWPLFLEDPPLYDGLPLLCERIDLIFSAGPSPLSVERTGLEPGLGGVYASDHAGVVATFSLENHRPDVPVRHR